MFFLFIKYNSIALGKRVLYNSVFSVKFCSLLDIPLLFLMSLFFSQYISVVLSVFVL